MNIGAKAVCKMSVKLTAAASRGQRGKQFGLRRSPPPLEKGPTLCGEWRNSERT